MERESAPPLTRMQLLLKLVDEWKGENQLQLKQIYKKYPTVEQCDDIDVFMQEGFLNVSIANCDFFIKLINNVNMLIPPDCE